jgi:hypothetical protein
MHAITIYIDENINIWERVDLCETLCEEPHVANVELHAKTPHDLLVEFEAWHNIPMHTLDILKSQGLHGDIVGT